MILRAYGKMKVQGVVLSELPFRVSCYVGIESGTKLFTIDCYKQLASFRYGYQTFDGYAHPLDQELTVAYFPSLAPLFKYAGMSVPDMPIETKQEIMSLVPQAMRPAELFGRYGYDE